jgi:hypothetical protein
MPFVASSIFLVVPISPGAPTFEPQKRQKPNIFKAPRRQSPSQPPFAHCLAICKTLSSAVYALLVSSTSFDYSRLLIICPYAPSSPHRFFWSFQSVLVLPLLNRKKEKPQYFQSTSQAITFTASLRSLVYALLVCF